MMMDLEKLRGTFKQGFLTDEQREQFIIFRERCRLYERCPGKYEAITTALYLAAYFNPMSRVFGTSPSGFAPAISVAYHFCRLVDDIADGDSPLPKGFETFEQVTENLKAQVNGTVVDKNSDLGFLLHRCISKLEEEGGSIDIRHELIAFLDAMQLEHKKRNEHLVFTEEELKDLYDDSFGPPHVIAFVALGSNAKASDIEGLMQLQGRLYAVRDLKDELRLGIINIPKDVLDESGLGKEALIAQPDLLDANTVIQAWIQREYAVGLKLIEQLRTKDLDWKAKAVIRFLVGPIETNIRLNQVLRDS